MSKFLSSSIGKKLLMSVTGLFLISFLCVHLGINLLLLIPLFNPADAGDTFNMAAHFMDTNPFIRVIEPVLTIGFIVHIIYASILTLQNQKARPVGYAVVDQSQSSSWQSRNMYILGGLVLAFLTLHIANFFYYIKFEPETLSKVQIETAAIHDTYHLVVNKLTTFWIAIIYVASAILLGLHLSHGFWSAFQSIGLNNSIWLKRLQIVALFFAFLFGAGFSIIPILLLLAKLI